MMLTFVQSILFQELLGLTGMLQEVFILGIARTVRIMSWSFSME